MRQHGKSSQILPFRIIFFAGNVFAGVFGKIIAAPDANGDGGEDTINRLQDVLTLFPVCSTGCLCRTKHESQLSTCSDQHREDRPGKRDDNGTKDAELALGNLYMHS